MSETFIRVYENAFSSTFCKNIIRYFEWCLLNNKTWERSEATGLYKKDTSTILTPYSELDFTSVHLSDYLQEFNNVFWDLAYYEYTKEFDTLNHYGKHTIFTYKVQKTLPGGGYHVWHAEQDSLQHARRILAYIVYLNDVTNGGETEFLYQHARIAPKEGNLVIFPSGYTHTHRGNPPLCGEKYILTGWVEFC